MNHSRVIRIIIVMLEDVTKIREQGKGEGLQRTENGERRTGNESLGPKVQR